MSLHAITIKFEIVILHFGICRVFFQVRSCEHVLQLGTRRMCDLSTLWGCKIAFSGICVYPYLIICLYFHLSSRDRAFLIFFLILASLFCHLFGRTIQKKRQQFSSGVQHVTHTATCVYVRMRLCKNSLCLCK